MISKRASSPGRSDEHPGQLAHRLVYDEHLGYVPLR